MWLQGSSLCNRKYSIETTNVKIVWGLEYIRQISEAFESELKSHIKPFTR